MSVLAIHASTSHLTRHSKSQPTDSLITAQRMATFDFLGITVLGDFILSEGVAGIIENLLRIGARRLALVGEHKSNNGLWINRYGYLSGCPKRSVA